MVPEQPYSSHYIAYSFTYLIYGLTFSGIGPLIPYLAEISHKDQTSYSFLFFCRAIGMIGGTFSFKYLQQNKILTYHHILAFSSIGIFLTCLSFTFSMTSLLQGISFTLVGFFMGNLETAINGSIMKLSSHANAQFIFLIIAGVFGLGGLFGPIFVYYFETNTFLVFGTANLIVFAAYFVLQSPEIIKKQEEIQQESDIGNKMSEFGVNLLCAMLFLYIGIVCSIGGWSSSYAVLLSVKTKEGAAIFPSLFWGCITVSRFFIAYLPGSSSQKLKICIQGSLTIQVFSLIIKYLGFVNAALLFQNIGLGFTISPFFPMLFSISKEFGYELNNNQLSKFVAAGPVGEGLLTMVCGLLMEWIHIDMYFYLVMAFLIAAIWCRIELVTLLNSKVPGQTKEKLIEMNNL